MKVCSVLVISVLVAGVVGCGGDGGTATSADDSPKERAATETAKAKREPNYPLPKLPPQRRPLKKIYIKDLEIGEGPVARWGDEVMVRHVAVYWRTGKIFTQHWGYATGHKIERQRGDHGWMTGLHGLRVGGLRELRAPSHLLYGGGDGAYIITIDKIKHGAAEKGQ